MNARSWLRAVCLLAFVIAWQPVAPASAASHSTGAIETRQAAPLEAAPLAAATSGPNREIFGFATAGSLGDATIGYPSWNFNLLSTVAFYAIRVNYNGVLIADSNWSVWDSSTLTNLVTTAHAHGVKVVVVLRNAFSDTTDFCDMLYNGDTTVLQIVNQVQQKGIDGVNIDYEGQLAQCNPTNPGLTPQSTQALLTAFAKNLRAGLDGARAGYYLSIDTYSGSAAGNDGFFNVPDLNQYVDSFFVMAYDMDYSNQGIGPMAGCTSFCMNPVSPLAGYYWNDTTSMSQYVAAVGAGKVILGQPYYGRVACVSSTGQHAHATGSVRAAGYLDAAAAITAPDVKAGTYTVHRGDSFDPNGADRWDTWYDLTYNCWSEMYWPDATQLSNRYDLVNADNLRGVGFWTLNYGGGANELWSAISYYFTSCKGAAISAAPPATTTVGSTVNVSARASGCRNPTYQFLTLAPGATTWQIAQPYSTSATFAWNTAGAVPGAGRVAVWVEDANSPGRYSNALGHFDASASMPYTTSSCTGASITMAPATGAAVTTSVTVTAHSTGCPTASPSYQFWLLAPGASQYQLAQAYSTVSTYTWDTHGVVPGAYHVGVWVRDANSAGAVNTTLGRFDASANAPYTIASCASASTTQVPATPAAIGSTVTVTAHSSGCPSASPSYEFWLLAPGASQYQVAQPYSTSATFSWSTNGVKPGTYWIGVWVRDAGSAGAHTYPQGSFDASGSVSYTVRSCTSAGLLTSPAGGARAGTSITVTARQSGCPNPSPQYEFWVLAPGGSAYTMVQAYSTTSQFTWNTAGLTPGTYRIAVWVRDAASGGAYSNALGSWDVSYSVAFALT